MASLSGTLSVVNKGFWRMLISDCWRTKFTLLLTPLTLLTMFSMLYRRADRVAIQDPNVMSSDVFSYDDRHINKFRRWLIGIWKLFSFLN